MALPYNVKGFSEALKRTYNAYGVNAYFKPAHMWSLDSFKDISDKKDITGPIYGIYCQGQTTRGKCKECYIGEREHSLKTSFLEHKIPSSTSLEGSNHIHMESPGHHIDLDEVKILDREPCWFERGVKEAIYIKVKNPMLIKDRAVQASRSLSTSLFLGQVYQWSRSETDSLFLMEDQGSSEKF